MAGQLLSFDDVAARRLMAELGPLECLAYVTWLEQYDAALFEVRQSVLDKAMRVTWDPRRPDHALARYAVARWVLEGQRAGFRLPAV